MDFLLLCLIIGFGCVYLFIVFNIIYIVLRRCPSQLSTVLLSASLHLCLQDAHLHGPHGFHSWFTTWWLIPLSKWVITPVISGLTLLIPCITGVITHLRAVGWATKQPRWFKRQRMSDTDDPWAQSDGRCWRCFCYSAISRGPVFREPPWLVIQVPTIRMDD